MKICILTTGHSAMDDRIFYKEALSLKKVYDDVTIIAPDERDSYIKDGINIIGVKKPNSLYERFRLVDTVVNEAIKNRADIYHFHDFEIIYKVLKIKKYLPDSKIIYDVHEYFPDMVRMSKKIPKLIKPFMTFFVDKTELIKARKFDYIITADDAVKERFCHVNKKVDVIYNFSEFKTLKEDKFKKKYDVIYQGGITMERGVFNAVRAIEIVKKKKPDIKMIFVGPFDDKEDRKKVYDYIEEKCLSKNIIFIGKVPHTDVESYIRSSKIGIVTLLPFPKYFKNIPIKQFEYMSCGIPVVGSDLPPIKKFVKSYNSGIIVDPTKPQEIADAIDKLLDDRELCKKLGENGIKAVSESYNWNNMEIKLLNIYKSLQSDMKC
ncbi:MAG: glycosyltransferase family 4 protein [Clostridiales bacterium]|nr:glycosyltransferase family 4 protein [Clostridiales bacterium]HBM79428.1 group 1 glycosyl transferase [Clostridiaceae bacterium]